MTQTGNLGWAVEKTALDSLGYSAPLPLDDPERAEAALAVNRDVAAHKRNPHKSQEEVRQLLADPGLQRAVKELCGTGFRLWRTALFAKEKGSGEIGWHHDKHFHADGVKDVELDAIGGHFSVLFGLTPIDRKTGLMEFLPGTHRSSAALTRDTRARYLHLTESHFMDIPPDVQAERRPVPIPAGSFVIFHSSILHRSLPHGGGVDRLGLAIRLVRSDLAIPAQMARADDIFDFASVAA